MNESFLKIFLEELVYESDEGEFIELIFQRVAERGLVVDNYIKKILWPLIRSHPQVLFLSTDSTFQNMTILELSCVPVHWICTPNESLPSPFVQFKIVASPELRIEILDLWNRPEISNSSTHLRLLSAIASKRYQGVSQVDLCEIFKNDPKWLFQNMKPFYKYDLIVRWAKLLSHGIRVIPFELHRRQLPVPSGQNKERAINNSNMFWLKRFFDLEFLSCNILKALQHLYRMPVSTKLLELLRSAPSCVMLESDFRYLCLQIFFRYEDAEFFTDPHTAIREYGKLRQDLIDSKKIVLIQAWCPERNKMCDSITLYEVAHQSGIMRKTKSSVTSTATTFSTPNLDEQSCMLRDSLQEGLSVDESRITHSESSVVHNVGEPHVKLPSTPSNKSSHQVFMVYELPIYQQVLSLINAVPEKGVLSTEISAVFGITPKRITRLLQNLEGKNLISRCGQRLGKHFVYQYVPKKTFVTPHLNLTTKTTTEADSFKRTGLKTLDCCSSNKDPLCKSEAAFLGKKLYTPKTQTQQFERRLSWVKETLEEVKVCTLPELIRKIGEKENNRGPDRKTVLRLLDHALFEDSRIKKTSLHLNGTDQMRIYYISSAITAEEAVEKASKLLNERRSEVIKGIMRQKSLACSKGNSVLRKLPSPSLPQDTGPLLHSNEPASGDVVHTKTELASFPNSANLRKNLSHFHRRSQHRLFLPHLHVDPWNRTDSKFSQAVLGHYGFIFPLMIRLKIFHAHLKDTLACDFGLESRDICSDAIKNIPTYAFKTLDVLMKMSIETFFRTIGCGYRHPYLDDILQNKLDITVFHRIEDLPTSISRILLYSSYRGWKPRRQQSNISRISAVVSVERLLQKLAVMKCVSLCRPDVTKDSTQENSNAVLSNSGVVWEVFLHVTLEPFFSLTHSREHVVVGEVRHFDLTDNEQFESFWKSFKGRVEQWLFALKYPTIWKATSLDNNFDNLFHLSLQPLLSRRSLALPKENEGGLFQFQLPDNMPLAVAFIKKNWAAKLLLTPAARVELQMFAFSLFNYYNSKKELEWSSAKEKESPSSITIEENFDKRDVYMEPFRDDMMETPFHKDSSMKTSQLITAQTPSVRCLAKKLNIPSDAVIRYLSRFFNPKLDSSFTHLPFIIYTGREPRYSCHLCESIYFQKPSLVQHYKLVHGQCITLSDIFLDERKVLSPLELLDATHRADNVTHNSQALAIPDVEKNVTNRREEKCCSTQSTSSRESGSLGELVSTFKREEILLFLGYAVIAQKLYNAMSHGSGEKSSCFFERGEFFPGTHHIVWKIMSELFSPTCLFYNASEKCRAALLLIINRQHSLARRILLGYSLILENSLQRLEVSPVSPNLCVDQQFIRYPMSPLMTLNFSMEQKITMFMYHNCLKVLLLSPLACYRPHWAVEIARFIETEKMYKMIHHWYNQNWIVKVKSPLNRWTPIQRSMDSKCRRKYCISYTMQQGFFKKNKDFLWARESLLASEDIQKQRKGFVSEPCQGAYLSALLKDIARETLKLHIVWETDEQKKLGDLPASQKNVSMEYSQESCKESTKSLESANQHDSDESDPGVELMKLLMDDVKRGDDNLDLLSFHDFESSVLEDLSLSSSERLNEEPSFFDNDDEDEDNIMNLDPKQRVVARAIEGGLEKHIKKLTPHIKNIADHPVMYVTYSHDTSSFLDCDAQVFSHLNKNSPSLKIFLPCEAVLSRLGSVRKSECPDLLLFSNITLTYFIQHCLRHAVPLQRCPEKVDLFGNPNVQLVPFYQHDVSTAWTWGTQTCEIQHEIYPNVLHPKIPSPIQIYLNNFILSFFQAKNIPVTSNQYPTEYKTLAQEFIQSLFNETHVVENSSYSQDMTLCSLVNFLMQQFPEYPKVNFHDSSQMVSYCVFFTFLTTMPKQTTWKYYFSEWDSIARTLFTGGVTATLFIDCLFYIFRRVEKEKNQGITEEILQADFNKYLNENHMIILEKKEKNTTASSKATMLSFEFLLFGLEMLRLVVRFPADNTWILLAGAYASEFCTAKRSLLGINILQYSPQDYTLVASTSPSPIFSLGALDEILQTVIPKRIWFLWGPPSECHWDALVHAFHQNRLPQFLSCLTEFHLILLFLRTFFFSFTLNYSDPFFTALTTEETPCCGWIQADGHLNATLIALFIHCLFFLCHDLPGATQQEIFSHTPALFRCETSYLLNILCEEAMLYTSALKEFRYQTQYFCRTPTIDLFI